MQVGYYDQTLGDLKPTGRVIDEVWDLDHTQTEEEVRSYLARFSFVGDDVFKKTRELSGGEKGRLALAKIMYVGGNVMLLDEPTNHLDVYTREALEEALENFTGALIVVSHDRYFIDRVAENVIVVEDGSADVYAGNYSELVARFKEGAAMPEKVQIARSRPRNRCCRRRKTRAAATAQSPVDREEKKKRDKRMKKIDEEIAAARVAHRLGGSRARAQRPPALLAGSLPRRRPREEDPAAESRSEGDDRSAVDEVGSAGSEKEVVSA